MSSRVKRRRYNNQEGAGIRDHAILMDADALLIDLEDDNHLEEVTCSQHTVSSTTTTTTITTTTSTVKKRRRSQSETSSTSRPERSKKADADKQSVPQNAGLAYSCSTQPRGQLLQTVESCVPFKSLCSLFEQVCKDKARTRIHRFGKFFTSAEQHRVEHNLAMDYFAFMRLILPQLDTGRRYGVKESRLARAYTKYLAIDRNSSDARALEKWKDPRFNEQGNRGQAICFSDTVFNILVRRRLANTTSSPSIADINDILTRMSALPENNKEDIIREIAQKLSAVEQKWLIRIILKDLKMNLRHHSILGHFHEYALDLFNATSDLKLVCQKCRPGLPFRFDMKSAIALFKPLKPMLASNIKDLDRQLQKLLEEGDYCIEPKYDGERMMVHKKGNTVRYFSRRSVEFTFYYQQFTDHILQNVQAEECILDGEMMVWNREKNAFNEFGNNRSLGANWGRKEPSQSENFCYICFDVIMCNGEVVLDKSYGQRRKMLESFVKPVDHVLELVGQLPVSTRKSVFAELDKAISNMDEGIILKDMRSTYQLDKRNHSWIKVKPDHFFKGQHFMGETFDLLIVGAYYGTKFGRRSLSHFLCALATSVGSAVFHSFCKVGTGYTRDELLRLQFDMQGHWREYRKGMDAPMLDGWVPQSGEIPDVIIDHPQNGIVIEVLAADIVDTDKFKVNKTLRFPRMKRRRDDKNWLTCDTIDRLDELVAANRAGRYRNRQDSLDSFAFTSSQEERERERNIGSRRRHIPSVLNTYALADTSRVQLESQLFAGWEFCVFSGDDKNSLYDKQSIETEIARHKGSYVANPGPNTKFIIAGNKTSIKVKNWCRGKLNLNRDKDIVHYRWLLESIRQGRIVPLHPCYMIYTTKHTRERFKVEIDQYGDSHTEDVTVDQLKMVFENVKMSAHFRLANIQQVQRISTRYDVISNEFQSLFMHPVKAYVDMYQAIGDERQMIESSPLVFDDIRLRLYGATCVTHIDRYSAITHVIVDLNDLSRLNDIIRLFRSCHNIPLIVSREWSRQCFMTKCLVEEDEFLVLAASDKITPSLDSFSISYESPIYI